MDSILQLYEDVTMLLIDEPKWCSPDKGLECCPIRTKDIIKLTEPVLLRLLYSLLKNEF